MIGRTHRVKCPGLARGAEYLERSQWQFERKVPLFDPDALRDRKRGCRKHAIERGIRGIHGEIAHIDEQTNAQDCQEQESAEQNVALN